MMNIIFNQKKYNIMKERKGQLCNILEYECLSLYLNIHLISDFRKQTQSYNWYWKHHILIANRRKYKLSDI